MTQTFKSDSTALNIVKTNTGGNIKFVYGGEEIFEYLASSKDNLVYLAPNVIAIGENEISEICIVADSPNPISPCGGCRQKLAEFCQPSVPVHLANLDGILESHSMAELLPNSFSSDHLPNE